MSNTRKKYTSVFDLKEGETYTPTFKDDSKFTFSNQSQKNNLYENLLNRQPNPAQFKAADFNFQYDSDTDKNFQDYAKMMRESGQKAMTDTMARASAQTGGYGNSYAAMAGQSVYNDYLNEIGKAKTEFEDRAYEKALNEYNIANEKAMNEYNLEKAAYDNETNDMLTKLELLSAQEAEERALYDSELAADKADWESAYQEDLARATREGDFDALAKLYGFEDAKAYQDYETSTLMASLAAPTQEIYDQAIAEYLRKGYLGSVDDEYAMDNILDRYAAMGYNTSSIAEEMKQARGYYENVIDRDFTYVSGKGKAAVYQDQFGNEFYYDELLNWAKDQGSDVGQMKDKLKAAKSRKSSED